MSVNIIAPHCLSSENHRIHRTKLMMDMMYECRYYISIQATGEENKVPASSMSGIESLAVSSTQLAGNAKKGDYSRPSKASVGSPRHNYEDRPTSRGKGRHHRDSHRQRPPSQKSSDTQIPRSGDNVHYSDRTSQDIQAGAENGAKRYDNTKGAESRPSRIKSSTTDQLDRGGEKETVKISVKSEEKSDAHQNRSELKSNHSKGSGSVVHEGHGSQDCGQSFGGARGRGRGRGRPYSGRGRGGYDSRQASHRTHNHSPRENYNSKAIQKHQQATSTKPTNLNGAKTESALN